MTVTWETFTAAKAAKGENLANGLFWEKSQYTRQITGIALVGSTAAGDTIIGIYYGTTKVMQITNSSTGVAVDTDKDLIPHNSSLACPAGVDIRVVVETAPNTNPIAIELIIAELP